MVDSEFLANGLIEKAIECVDKYVEKIEIQGITRKFFQPEGSSPLLVYIIEPSGGSDKNVLLYGHLDKMPWMDGWDEGLGPTTPVRRGDYLYGRGGADDGYAVFSSMLAIKNLQL